MAEKVKEVDSSYKETKNKQEKKIQQLHSIKEDKKDRLSIPPTVTIVPIIKKLKTKEKSKLISLNSDGKAKSNKSNMTTFKQSIDVKANSLAFVKLIGQGLTKLRKVT